MLGWRWLSVLAMACACVPGFGLGSGDSSICSDLSNKGRIQDCITLCMSLVQAEYQELAPLVDANDELLQSIILASLTSEDNISETNMKGNAKEPAYATENFRWSRPSVERVPGRKLGPKIIKRRPYSMEHFRWSKPSRDKAPDKKKGPKGEKRRSYSMQHFRWGKPSARKQHQVKSSTSGLEGGGSLESGSNPTRRQLSGEDELKGDLDNIKGLLRAKTNSKPHTKLNPQKRRDGTLRRRSPSTMKPNEDKPQGKLAKFTRDIVKICRG